MSSRYRRVLRHNTDRASVPYGYTAMNVAGVAAIFAAAALVSTMTYFLVAGIGATMLLRG